MRNNAHVPRWMTAWRTEEITVPSPHPPEVALRLVRDGIDARRRHQVSTSQADFVIVGSADEHRIRISAAHPHITNDWRTRLRARIVRDGSGSVLVGRLGWRPATAVLTVTVTLTLVAGWAFVAGGAMRALFLGYPVVPSLGAVLIVTVLVAFWAGLVAGGERSARAETAHLRTWVGERLNAPAPPAPAPRPRPPAPRPRPPTAPGAPPRLRPSRPA